MARFAVNATRYDPYKNFKFRVKWDGRYVAGISKVSALRRSTEVVEYREGGQPNSSRRSPGRTEYEPITLERGLTHDSAFEDWANQPWTPGAELAPASFRKNVSIELCNPAGQVMRVYKVRSCWISKYQALPDLGGDGKAKLIESITLEHEGWERDTSLPKPREPRSRTKARRSSTR
ncbi:MAG TPA: phage tail protein [Gemmatimonadales bacterium]|nr:phage tail protein [Gemmatimonadales bacterium]